MHAQNALTLKTGLEVRQGHWKCHHSIERIRLPINYGFISSRFVQCRKMSWPWNPSQRSLKVIGTDITDRPATYNIILILGPPNFWTNRAIRFKFGTDIQDGPFLRVHHKKTPKWAWPGSRDPISKFLDPVITGKTSKVNYMYINNNKTANIKGKNWNVYNDV